IGDEPLDDLAERFEPGTKCRISRLPPFRSNATIPADRPLERGQVRVLPNQLAALVEHGLDTVDDVPPGLRDPAYPGHSGIAPGRDRRLDQFRLVRKVVVQTGAGHI